MKKKVFDKRDVSKYLSERIKDLFKKIDKESAKDFSKAIEVIETIFGNLTIKNLRSLVNFVLWLAFEEKNSVFVTDDEFILSLRDNLERRNIKVMSLVEFKKQAVAG